MQNASELDNFIPIKNSKIIVDTFMNDLIHLDGRNNYEICYNDTNNKVITNNDNVTVAINNISDNICNKTSGANEIDTISIVTVFPINSLDSVNSLRTIEYNVPKHLNIPPLFTPDKSTDNSTENTIIVENDTVIPVKSDKTAVDRNIFVLNISIKNLDINVNNDNNDNFDNNDNNDNNVLALGNTANQSVILTTINTANNAVNYTLNNTTYNTDKVMLITSNIFDIFPKLESKNFCIRYSNSKKSFKVDDLNKYDSNVSTNGSHCKEMFCNINHHNSTIELYPDGNFVVNDVVKSISEFSTKSNVQFDGVSKTMHLETPLLNCDTAILPVTDSDILVSLSDACIKNVLADGKSTENVLKFDESCKSFVSNSISNALVVLVTDNCVSAGIDDDKMNERVGKISCHFVDVKRCNIINDTHSIQTLITAPQEIVHYDTVVDIPLKVINDTDNNTNTKSDVITNIALLNANENEANLSCTDLDNIHKTERSQTDNPHKINMNVVDLFDIPTISSTDRHISASSSAQFKSILKKTKIFLVLISTAVLPVITTGELNLISP
jgi:hypothetical protein